MILLTLCKLSQSLPLLLRLGPHLDQLQIMTITWTNCKLWQLTTTVFFQFLFNRHISLVRTHFPTVNFMALQSRSFYRLNAIVPNQQCQTTDGITISLVLTGSAGQHVYNSYKMVMCVVCSITKTGFARLCTGFHRLAIWHSGSIIRHMNEITLHRAQLIIKEKMGMSSVLTYWWQS